MKHLLITFFGLLFNFTLYAQADVFGLMEREDLSITEIEERAKQHFDTAGTGRGSGYKQYQRWLYERSFHLDENGYFISPELENEAYQAFASDQEPSVTAAGTWKELGPYKWTYTRSWNPGNGRVTAIAIHPANESIIYVSSPGGGIWKTEDAGQTWRPLVDFTNSAWMNIMYICVDPHDPNTLYACLSSSGIIKSTDAGNTWAVSGTGVTGGRKVVVHPQDPNIVFAAGSNGIYRSTNAGANWTRVNGDSKEDIEFKPNDPNIMYASGASGSSSVWRSTNTGQTWQSITIPNGITHVARTLIAVSPADPEVVYAVQASGSLFGRLYKSTNAGISYTTIITGDAANGTNFFGYETNGRGTTGQAGYDMAMCVNPLNANEVHIAGIICWKSLNGGMSFEPETAWSYPNNIGYNHADMHVLEWINNTIYSGSDGGIFKSINNGADWINLSVGLATRQIYRLTCSKTDANVITIGAQDNGSSFRRSEGEWVDWLGADGMDSAISPVDENIAIGTSQNGGIYRTRDAGASQQGLTKPTGGNWVTPLVWHPTSADTVYGGWEGIFRSSNQGSNWTKISGTAITANLTCLAVAPSNPQFIYGTIGNTIFRTSDGGDTWTTVSAQSGINAICVSPRNPQKIYIACNNATFRVFVSTNMGTTFTDLSAGLPAMSARAIVADDNARESVYVGMNIGVYYRDNVNTNWVEHATGLPLVGINDLEIQKSFSKLRVATYGRGVWESDLRLTSSSCAIPANPAHQNISATRATIKWSAMAGSTNYDLQYKDTTSKKLILVPAIKAAKYDLTGLTPNTVYQYQVKSNCGTNYSNYSVFKYFRTNDTCIVTPVIQAKDIEEDQATITWAPVANASSYTIRYRPTTDSMYTEVTDIKTAFYIIKDLIPQTAYFVQIKSSCGTSLQSNFDNSVTFTTAPKACPAPAKLIVGEITGVSVALQWEANPRASRYFIKYTKAGNPSETQLPPTTEPNVVIKGLKPNSTYTASVFIVCENGVENKSEIQFKTGNTLPGDPTHSLISILPNPVKELVKITLSTSFDLHHAKMEVFDVYGVLKSSQRLTSRFIQIDARHYIPGTYQVHVTTDKEKRVVKFIKE